MSARVVITGAAGGIGARTVELLTQRGAAVAGLDLKATGDIIACDVRDQASVDGAIAAAAERLGGIDVLVNCAGVGVPQGPGLAPDAAALAVLDVNLVGPWRVSAAALPHLRESRGRVINVASGLAHLTVPLATAYCMSKRALVTYSDALRIEQGDAISVTTVYPGYIRTPIHDAAAESGLTLEGLVPVEHVDHAARTLVRAALGPRPPRDLATTRRATVSYALLRLAPRRLVDRVMLAHLRRAAGRGHFDGAQLAESLRRRLLEGGPGRPGTEA